MFKAGGKKMLDVIGAHTFGNKLLIQLVKSQVGTRKFLTGVDKTDEAARSARQIVCRMSIFIELLSRGVIGLRTSNIGA